MQQTAYAHEQLAEVFKATADATRVRILAVLLGAGELCVCHVEEALGITQSRASRHLSTLKRAGLVVDRRDGSWVNYRVPRTSAPVARAILRAVREAVADDPATAEDVKRAAALRDDVKCVRGER